MSIKVLVKVNNGSYDNISCKQFSSYRELIHWTLVGQTQTPFDVHVFWNSLQEA